MAQTVDAVIVELEARLDKYTGGVRAGAVQFDTAIGKIERAGLRGESAVVKLGAGLSTAKTILAGFAGGIAASALQTLPTLLIGAAKTAVDYAGSLGEASQQLGVTTRFLQEFRFGATQSGASVEQADVALAKFSRTIGEAASGSKTATADFRALGVSLTDSEGRLKSTDVLYAQVADAIAKIPEPARQSSAAFSIFGKGATAILPLLKSGSAGFSEMATAAGKLGLVLSDKTIDGLDKLADKGAAVKQVITTQLAAAIGENADTLLALGDAAAGAVGKFADLLREMRGVAALASRGDFVQILTTGDKSLQKLGTAAGRASYDAQKVEDLKKRIAANSNIKGSEPFVRELRGQLAAAQKQAAASLEAGLAEMFPAPKGASSPPQGGVLPPVPDKPDPRSSGRERGAAAAARAAEKTRELLSTPVVSDQTPSEALQKSIDGAEAAARRLGDALGPIDVEILPGIANGLADIKDETERAAAIADDFKRNLANGLADAIVNGGNLGDVLVDSFKRAAAAALAAGLLNLFSGGTGSSALAAGGSAFKKILGFAGGGRPAAGVPYIVGERGPELRIDGPGQIIPNNRIGGGSTAVYVTQHLHFDVGLESVDQRIQQAAPILVGAAQRGTIDALRNAGIGQT